MQTVDGTTRIYVMPYSADEGSGSAETVRRSTMWQLSFPLGLDEAKALCAAGPTALRDEALRLCSAWHAPIPELIQATTDPLLSA